MSPISSRQCLVPQSEKVFPVVHREHPVFHMFVPTASCSVISTTEKGLAANSFVPSIQIFVHKEQISLSLPITRVNSPDSQLLLMRDTSDPAKSRWPLMDLLKELCHNRAIACFRYNAISVPSLSLFFHNYFNSCF